MNFITYYSPAKHTSPSSHPQPDGIVEWFKGTLKAVTDEGKDYDKLLLNMYFCILKLKVNTKFHR